VKEFLKAVKEKLWIVQARRENHRESGKDLVVDDTPRNVKFLVIFSASRAIRW